MMRAVVLGIDPGQTTGIWCADVGDGRIEPLDIRQIYYRDAPDVLEDIAAACPHAEIGIIAVEHFILAANVRYQDSQNAFATREVMTYLPSVRHIMLELMPHVYVQVRTARTVKAWATDDRLRAAGIYDVTKGMGHARDASRHALYAVVKAGFLEDPLIEEVVR